MVKSHITKGQHMLHESEIIYKTTKSGKITEYKVRVTNGNQEGLFVIYSIFGLIEGTKTTTSTEHTKALDKVIKKANSIISKKLNREGYYETKELAVEDKRKKIRPMLAQDYTKEVHAKKIVFPCLYQPKLDGHRCIAEVTKDKCTLYTRKGEEILSMPHIQDQLLSLYYEDVVLDGELIDQDGFLTFNDLSSIVRTKNPTERSQLVSLVLFDAIVEGNTPIRNKIIVSYESDNVSYLPLGTIWEEDEIGSVLQEQINCGYEGIMLRNIKAEYCHGRTSDLQKVKEFEDLEFLIVDVVAGQGRMEKCGIFVCETVSGKTFRVKQDGPLAGLYDYLENKDKYIGKQVTVRFQELSPAGIPRFPVAKGVRY